jgi:hypothetical protein
LIAGVVAVLLNTILSVEPSDEEVIEEEREENEQDLAEAGESVSA